MKKIFERIEDFAHYAQKEVFVSVKIIRPSESSKELFCVLNAQCVIESDVLYYTEYEPLQEDITQEQAEKKKEELLNKTLDKIRECMADMPNIVLGSIEP